MNKREKTLLFLTVGIALVFIAGFGFKVYFLDYLEKIDGQLVWSRDQLNKQRQLALSKRQAMTELQGFARVTFGDEVDEAAARAGEHITMLLTAAGLNENLFTRTPTGARAIRGRHAQEISWSVSGRGSMQNVVNLLYLLEEDQHLHRVENLMVRPRDNSVSVDFRYLSLVLSSAPVTEREELLVPELTGDRRAIYDTIEERDIFRPYIKTSPEPVPVPVSVPAGPGPESYRVVSLSQWKGVSEVLVLDLNSQKTTKYLTGDDLAGGVLVQVDYRALPRPRKPGLKSPSRVIIDDDGIYWAVESGDTLADKYRLSPEQLPPELAGGRR